MLETRAPGETTLELATLRAAYLAAQLRGDRRAALKLVLEDGLAKGASIRELSQAVVQEAQREIGRLWQENQISIAQEHMATAISHVVLAHLYDLAERAPTRGRKVLVACVEGELHDFPARLAADALDLAGFDVRYLGASVPTDSLLKMIEQERPDLLALSVTMAFNLPALREAVARVRAALGDELPIAVGGGACSWAQGTASEIGADVTGADAQELVEAVRRLWGETS